MCKIKVGVQRDYEHSSIEYLSLIMSTSLIFIVNKIGKTHSLLK